MRSAALTALIACALVPALAGNLLVLIAPNDPRALAVLHGSTLGLALLGWWAAARLCMDGGLAVPRRTVDLAGAARVATAVVALLVVGASSPSSLPRVGAAVADIAFWTVVLLGSRPAAGSLSAAAAVTYTVARTSALAFLVLDEHGGREPFLWVHRVGSVVAAGLIALCLVRLRAVGAVDTMAGAQKEGGQEAS